MQDDELLTLEQVAEALHVNVRTVRRRIASGVLRAYRLGGQRLYVKHSDLLAALEPVDPEQDAGAE